MLAKVFTVLRGVVLAQALGLMVMPVLSRLFPPVAFGEYQLYLSIMSILIGFIGLRYDLAIMNVKTEGEVRSLFQLATLANIALGILTWAGVEVAQLINWPRLIAKSELDGVSLGIATIAAGVIQTWSYLVIRHGRFALGSNIKVIQSLAFAGISIFFGIVGFGPKGIIWADVAQRIAGAALLVILFGSSSRSPWKQASVRRMRGVAIRQKAMPLFALPTGILTALSVAICPIMIYGIYGPGVAGQYGLFERSVILPLNLIILSVSQVASSELAREIRQKLPGGHEHFRQLAIRLALLAAAPFALFALFGPWAFSLVFGPQWALAASLCPLFALTGFLSFVSGATGLGFQLIDRPKLQFHWEIARLASLTTVWAGVYWFKPSVPTALLCHFCVLNLYMLVYLVMFDSKLKAFLMTAQRAKSVT